MGIMKSIKKLGNNNLQVLISVQNLRNDADVDKLIKPMNLASDYLIVNQCFDNNIKIENENVITKPEKGLSKSRNLAIKSSKSDIILFADDDVRYNKNYKDIILKSYDKYKDADIICFYIESQNKKRKTKRMHTGKIGYIRAMRVVSTEICCKRESIIKNNLKFNEEFGAGTRFNRGEENIFLYEAIRKGLKVIWVNEKIGEILQEESTWFKEYDEEFFRIQGRVFKELSNKFYMIYILNTAIKQYWKYKEEISFGKAIKAMLEGTKMK